MTRFQIDASALANQLLALFPVQQFPAVEWIDETRIQAIFVLDHKVTRQTYPEHGFCKPPRNLHVHHRERNRYAKPPRQHIIEATVARIVIIGFISTKAQFLEEVLVHGRDKSGAI